MAVHIRIAGVDIERVNGSLSITNFLNQRSTASFVIADRTGLATYFRGQIVEIFADLAIPPFIHPLFTGFIDYPTRQKAAPTSNILYWSIACMDNRYLAEKRLAIETYIAQTAGYIVDDLVDKYLAAEGVTIGSIEAGPVIAELVINYSQISKVFDVLAERSDFIWRIDKDKQLWFTARTTTAAPFFILASDITRDPNITSSLKDESPMYRNRQYVRAGQAVTVLQTRNSTGDGVATDFAMGYPLSSAPTVTVGGAPKTVGVRGVDTGKDVYWSYGDSLIYFAVAPGLGAAIVTQYYGLYDLLVKLDDLAAQAALQALEGGTGIVESLEEAPTITTKIEADATALLRLNYYTVGGRQFNADIRKWGLEPGQLVPVTHTPYGLAATSLLVESVMISEVAPGELKYSVRAVSGPELGDWTGFFKALATAITDVTDRIIIGEDQVPIIFVEDSDIWEWSEVVAETIFACPLCAPALFCDPGLEIC